MRFGCLCFILPLLGTLGCAGTPGTPGRPPATLEYHVAPPDVLSISVRPEPVITREVTVRPDGRISFDLIGDMDVRGKTIAEIQTAIQVRIKEYIVHPDVTVTLSQSNSRKFYVFGEVLDPGAYPLIGDVNAVEALATASGPTRFAALGEARLLRPTGETAQAYAVDFTAITTAGDGSTNYALQPGDVIFLPPNTPAKIGYALGKVLFPFHQILGLGGGSIYRGGY